VSPVQWLAWAAVLGELDHGCSISQADMHGSNTLSKGLDTESLATG
jgi:hypothetical protein